MKYVIYHEVKPNVPCPDGLAAAWVVRTALLCCGDGEFDFIGRCYDDERPLPIPEYEDEVYIVDFSLPSEVLEQWATLGAKVVVIDHHKTALENLSGLSDRVLQRFDINESGATLAWNLFFPNKRAPRFLQHIKDRDLWNFDIDGTQEIHEAMGAMGRSFALFDALADDPTDQILNGLRNVGEKLLEPKRKAIAAAVERLEWGEVAGYSPIPFVRTTPEEDRLTSDICSKLYKAHPNAHFVACLTSDGTWSLRSDKNGNNTDVGAIAKSMGGGGHRNASGFKP